MMKALVSALTLALTALSGPAFAEISYVGSSTIGEHIMPEAARVFAKKTGIRFGAIEIQGSGKGLEMVLQGQAQLAGVSRSLTLDEKTRRIHYQVIGYDAVTVFVHPTNPVTTLTREQLKSIYTGRITNWKDVGGPDARIVCITQIWGAKRGQMIEFQQEVMDGAPFRRDRREVDRQSDQVTVLISERYGITAVSLAFARQGIRAVSIDGFQPEPKNIRSGAYILSRPLLLVSEARPKGEVKQFLNFMLSPEGQEIVAWKFVPVR
jgi:phosphate transport system substrate-binding protein